jgi:LacI family transcriptional regulator
VIVPLVRFDMRVTLKTIAKETGYSITTVSRALAGYDDVAAETCRYILETAERLGYRPHEVARQLQAQRSNTVGIIIPTFGTRFADPFFSELLAGIAMRAAEHRFDLLVSIQPPDSGELDAYKRMENGRVDGLIVVRTRQDDPRIQHLRSIRPPLPFASFGRSGDDDDFPYVDVDGEHGVYMLTQHLIDLGHRRIGYVAPPMALNFTRHRLRGYRRALDANQLPYDEALVTHGELTQQDGARGANILLGLDQPPTAIIGGNDTMAAGVMRAVHERGLRVGEDIAVGGFDDLPEAEYANPPLTTVHQSVYEIGSQVCDMLIRILKKETLTQSQILIRPSLVIRESSGSGPTYPKRR